jgi:hypothetical protein
MMVDVKQLVQEGRGPGFPLRLLVHAAEDGVDDSFDAGAGKD